MVGQLHSSAEKLLHPCAFFRESEKYSAHAAQYRRRLLKEYKLPQQVYVLNRAGHTVANFRSVADAAFVVN